MMDRSCVCLGCEESIATTVWLKIDNIDLISEYRVAYAGHDMYIRTGLLWSHGVAAEIKDF